MNIDSRMAELFHINDLNISGINNDIDKINTFQIYDEFWQGYIPDDQGIPGLKALAKKQNVNAWSSKCNYLIAYIKKDLAACLKIIEEDKDIL